MNILGLSAFYHDSAAALISNGRIVAAAQEERFTRKKHDPDFPLNAINYCLSEARIAHCQLDYIVFYDKPFLKFKRLLETYLSFAPRGFSSFAKALPIWLSEKLFQKQLIRSELSNKFLTFDWQNKLLFSEHHLSHAASAFFPSPFREAVVLTMDGVGEWATTSVAIGRENSLEIVKELHFPHSLGLLYSAFTYYTGFKVNSGEYKVMGLAPYGIPRYKNTILNTLVDLKGDGSFRLDMQYFNYCTGLTMVNEKFEALFDIPVRKSGESLQQVHMDLAASIQAVTEEIVLRITRVLASEFQINNLCLAGGVALNCVANAKLLKDGAFGNIWIQPAAGDAGGALGAALYVHHVYLNQPRQIDQNKDRMHGAYLGPSYASSEIVSALEKMGAKFTLFDDETIVTQTARDLAEGKAIGWMQGRMEFGPRSLGNRSIIADARSVTMQSILNLKVKYRESFRPFAPSVLSENRNEWFELAVDSPYMLLVASVKENKRRPITPEQEILFGLERLKIPRSEIPAVTHVDYSARVQTVHAETNPKYHALISKFRELTGCPVIVNTSFNVRGEPIVCSPEDAFRCFMGTDIERLVVGNCYLKKEEQDSSLARNYKNQFELD